MEGFVKVRVSGVAQVDTPFGLTPILMLEDNSERVLIMTIGGAEAASIAAALSGSRPPVPSTHDFMKDVLDAVAVKIKRGEIYDIEANRFLARIIVESERGLSVINGRPSDVVALAVRSGADIYVNEGVMQRASVNKSMLLSEGEEEEEGGEIEEEE